MNLLILNYEYPPLGGGAANATYNLIRQFLGPNDISVTLVTSAVGSFRVEYPAKNVTLHFLDIGKTTETLHYQSFRDLMVYSWKAWRHIRKLQKTQHFDLIHAFFGIPCGFIARMLGIPYIVSLRGSDVPGYSPRMEKLERVGLKRLSRWIWKSAEVVTVNSVGLGQLAQRTLAMHYPVIPNGVDTEFFCPDHKKQVQNPKEPSTIGLNIVSTGRLIPRKGYHLLVNAIESEDTLVLIGDGPELNNLKNLAHGKEVKFLGNQPKDIIANELRKADIFVLPSLNEGMSNSLLEALATGLPVIVTNVGGTSELVRDNGLILSEISEEMLYNALSRIRTMDLPYMGQKSREIALTYSWSSMAISYLELYKACIE